MTLEHRTTVTDAAGRLDDNGENWTITLVDPRRTAYGIQRVHEVDPRRVPMHVLEAVMTWAHAGLNPEIDDDTDPPTDPPSSENVPTALELVDGPFYCVACGHDAHSPQRCAERVETESRSADGQHLRSRVVGTCDCSEMQEAPRP